MTALVTLRNVTKSYVRGKQKVEVLHGVDLEIDTGEFLALMGPSGSGKTTLLNLVAGLDQPTGGEVAVAGDLLSGELELVCRAPDVRTGADDGVDAVAEA